MNFNEIKICKHCKHCKLLSRGELEVEYCHRQRLDVVSGEISIHYGSYECVLERDSENKRHDFCGYDGKFWEPNV